MDSGGLFVARPPNDSNGRPRIRRLLIANRGEIACRIIATCQKLNVTSIAIYAEEDRESIHVEAADEAISLGSIEQAAGNPHQNAELIIKTAVAAKVDAIHPGYGYLSENADFAKRVKAANLIFVGPSADAISVLGDKRQAKDYLTKNAPSVPLIPGYSGTAQDAKELEKEATSIGYPVMIKAAAGGGGRGMRIVRDKESLQEELERAQSEAQRSFGSSDCLLEKYIEKGKHIEIQIMGDSSGHVISLFDRECSVQRRNQKIIEEAPSPWLKDDLRKKMMKAANEIGQQLKYENAGTVEFIVDIKESKFYFLEVNTRIQVEHAITEETTGVDIVALQLFIASGGLIKDLDLLANITQSGHSIECRLCAEDPTSDFMPDSGLILRWTPGTELLGKQQRQGVRIETAVRTGTRVSVYFDSMIAKIIVKAPDRATAISKMLDVLQHTVCIGIKTNLVFLQACLVHPAFNKFDYTTSLIPDNLSQLLKNPYIPDLSSTLSDFAFAPALFARQVADSARDALPYRPFGSIARGFRNQTSDRSNRAADVITANSSPENAHAFLLTWTTGRYPARDIFTYVRQSIQTETPELPKDAKPNTELVRHFNDTVTRLHQTTSPSNAARVISCTSTAHTTGSASWLTGSLLVEHDGTQHTLQIATGPGFNARDTGNAQRVYVHAPELGAALSYGRYSLLAYGEMLRADFAGVQAADVLRRYTALMPCKVLQVLKKKGDKVKKGEAMLVIESMKTEMKIVAALDGTFEPHVGKGDAVEDGVLLCELL